MIYGALLLVATNAPVQRRRNAVRCNRLLGGYSSCPSSLPSLASTRSCDDEGVPLAADCVRRGDSLHGDDAVALRLVAAERVERVGHDLHLREKCLAVELEHLHREVAGLHLCAPLLQVG